MACGNSLGGSIAAPQTLGPMRRVRQLGFETQTKRPHAAPLLDFKIDFKGQFLPGASRAGAGGLDDYDGDDNRRADAGAGE
jgi:hypothetical protein